MELRRYLKLFRTRWWISALTVLACAGAAYLTTTFVLQKQYTASATFEVNIPVITQAGQNATTVSVVATDAQLPTSFPVALKAVKDVGVSSVLSPRRLLDHVACSPSDLAQTFTCTLTYPDRLLAVRLLDSLGRFAIATNNANQASQLRPLVDKVNNDIKTVQADLTNAESLLARPVTGVPQYAVTARIDADNSRLTSLQRQLLSLQQTAAAQSTAIIVLNPAEAPTSPSSPRPVLDTILAAMLGLMIGVAGTLLIEYLDDSPASPEHASQELGVAVFGTVPRFGRDDSQRVPLLTDPHSAGAEAYRLLRTNTTYANVDSPFRSILVTSGLEGDGKTTVAANLAVAFAQFGASVVLVDADLRRPSVHKMLSLSVGPAGLTSALVSRHPDAWKDLLLDTSVHNLCVLPSGPLPPNPAEILSSVRMQALLSDLTTSFRIVIIDSPPVLAVTDSLVLATLTDAVIFVTDTQRWKLHVLREAKRAIESVGATISGLVLNRVSGSDLKIYRYYQSAHDVQTRILDSVQEQPSSTDASAIS